MSETIHGTAVLAGAQGVLLRGPSGAGKSMLAAQMIARGGRLVADDRVHLSACHGRLLATPPAPIAGRMELRNRGVLSVPYERSAVIRLVVDLVAERDLERLPEDAQLVSTILGVALPRQGVPAASGAALMLVEAALSGLAPHSNATLRPIRVWGMMAALPRDMANS